MNRTFVEPRLFVLPALVCLALITTPALAGVLTMVDGADLTADSNALVAGIQARPTIAEIGFLIVGDLAPLAANEPVVLDLLGRSIEVTDPLTELRSETDFSYTGWGEDGTRVALVVRDGEITGSVRTPYESFRILPLAGGMHLVVRIDEVNLAPSHSVDPLLESAKQALPLADELIDVDLKGGEEHTWEESEQPVISLLFAYTEAVAASQPAMESLAQLAVDESNLFYEEIGARQRVSLAGVVLVAYTESGSMADDLARIREDGDGVADEIHQQRLEKLADVVVLVLDDASYCGMASQYNAGPATAFLAIHHDCIVGADVIAGELARLQGFTGDPANDGFAAMKAVLDSTADRTAALLANYTDRIYPSNWDGNGSGCYQTDTWFNYGSCGDWKEYPVTSGSWLSLYAYGDSCTGCVLYHINFKIQEHDWLFGWQTKETHNPGPDFKGMIYTTSYKPSSDKIRIQAPEGFYVKVYRVGVTNGGFETGSWSPGWLTKYPAFDDPSITSDSTYVANRGKYSLGKTGGGTTSLNNVLYWGYGIDIQNFTISSSSRVYFDTYCAYYSQYAHYHVKVWWTTGGDTEYCNYIDYSKGIASGWSQQVFAFPSSAYGGTINKIEIGFHKDHSTILRYKPTIYMDNITLR